MSKNIICDLDGAVVEYDYPKMIKKHFGVSILPEWINCHNLEDALGLPPKGIEKMFIEEDKEAPNFIPGAINALLELKGQGFNIVLFSRRVKLMGFVGLYKWVVNWGIPFYNLAKDYADLPAFAVAAIDDRPSKLLKIDAVTRVDKLILYPQPRNERCHDILGKFTWVRNWKDILEELDDLGGN